MPVVTKYPAGTPSWVDLGTPDPDAGSRFYSGLFGWQIEEGPPEAGGYRMCMLDGQPVAGQGGAVSVPPTDIPVGRLSVVNDPQGVVFSITKMNQFDPAP